MRALLLVVIMALSPQLAQANSLDDLFRMNRSQLIERMLDNGGIILGERPTTLRREHVGRRLICSTDNKATLYAPMLMASDLKRFVSINATCRDGKILFTN